MIALIPLIITNIMLIVALVLLDRSNSAERRILWASVLEAQKLTDASRRAAGPTHAEAQKSVEQQIQIQKEMKEAGGVFGPNNPFSNQKPIGT